MKVYKAVEDAITDLIPLTEKLWEEAKGKPKFTPAEINACFPDLYKTEAHNFAMRRVASKDKSPEGKHIVAVCDYIPRLRNEDYTTAWEVGHSLTFKGANKEELQQYITDALLLWSSPCKATAETARQLLAEAGEEDYLAEIFEDYKAVRKKPSIVLQLMESLHQTEIYAKKKHEKSERVTDEYELDQVRSAIAELKSIKNILDGNYAAAWKSIKDSVDIYTNSDVASRFIELMRVFKL